VGTSGEERKKAWAKVVARAWADADFKEKLVKDPLSVLKQEGLAFPEGAKVKVIEATGAEVHLIIPPKPENAGPGVEEVQERLANFFGAQFPY